MMSLDLLTSAPCRLAKTLWCKGNSHRSPKSAKAIVWLRVSSLLA